MTQSEKDQAVIKEWRRQAFVLSIQSDDNLNSVFLKSFDAISVVFNSSDHRKIQHALESLDSERSICLRFENTTEPSIRSLMYGIIESLHISLLHLTEHREPSEEAISIVEEWKRKTFDFSNQSDDSILSVFLKVFEAISAILRTSEYCHNRKIQKALESLKSERIICLRFEETNEPSIRSVLLGLIECIHYTLLHLTEEKTETKPTKEIPKQLDEVSRHSLVNPAFTPNEDSHLLPNHSMNLLPSNSALEFMGNEIKEEEMADEIKEKEMAAEIKEEDMLDEIKEEEIYCDVFPMSCLPYPYEPKEEEELDEDLMSTMNFENGSVDLMSDDLIDKENKKKNTIDSFSDHHEIDAIDTDEVEKEPEELQLNYNGYETVQTENFESESCDPMDDDLIDEPTKLEEMNDVPDEPQNIVDDNRDSMADNFVVDGEEKKGSIDHTDESISASAETRDIERRSTDETSQSNLMETGNLVMKENEGKNVLQCPQCDYRSQIAGSWNNHIIQKHSTTPKKAGYILRCDCGHESHHFNHSYKCKISNFTVKMGFITKENESDKNELECPLCEYRSQHPFGWMSHLRTKHNLSPLKAGYYLRCDCGYESHSQTTHKCDIWNFAVKKGRITKTIDSVKNELECPQCDYRSQNASSWEHHVRVKHSTTLMEAGYILRCDCGHESHNFNHSYKCKISNFTVKMGFITKENESDKNELECPLCEYRSQHAYGWKAHFSTKHFMSPVQAGYYLRCDCGYESHSRAAHECDISNFTVIKGWIKKNTDSVKNELECPECEYRSQTPGSWIKHLRRNHSTTPTLAGFLLRCDCGFEYDSLITVHPCKVSNFTVVRVGDGPIGRLTDYMSSAESLEGKKRNISKPVKYSETVTHLVRKRATKKRSHLKKKSGESSVDSVHGKKRRVSKPAKNSNNNIYPERKKATTERSIQKTKKRKNDGSVHRGSTKTDLIVNNEVEEDTIDTIDDIQNDASETPEVEDSQISGNVSVPQSHAESMEEFDGVDEPAMKKSKFETEDLGGNNIDHDYLEHQFLRTLIDHDYLGSRVIYGDNATNESNSAECECDGH